MKELTKDDLQLVLDAARYHYHNDKHWQGLHEPAYFEANMRRAENRTKLGEAIDRIEIQMGKICVGQAITISHKYK